MLFAHNLEHESGERSLRVGRSFFLFPGLWIHADDGGYIERARKVIDDGVQKRLHALVLERGAGDDRDKLQSDGFASQRRANLIFGDLLAAQVLLGYLIVSI